MRFRNLNWRRYLTVLGLIFGLTLASLPTAFAGDDPDDNDIVVTDPVSAPSEPVCAPR